MFFQEFDKDEIYFFGVLFFTSGPGRFSIYLSRRVPEWLDCGYVSNNSSELSHASVSRLRFADLFP